MEKKQECQLLTATLHHSMLTPFFHVYDKSWFFSCVTTRKQGGKKKKIVNIFFFFSALKVAVD